MAYRVPRLQRVCVVKIVEEIKHFCCGLPFDDLGKFLHIIGPFEYLSSQCIESIFDYVVSTRQLNQSWLSLLIVSHLRTVDFSSFPSAVNSTLFKMLVYRCKCLVHLIVPNCKKISNVLVRDLLSNNPSLLQLDISNKLSPKVDSSVVESIACSCRYLQVLKLSDYRLEDPKNLLVLCGRVYCDSQAVVACGSSTEALKHSISNVVVVEQSESAGELHSVQYGVNKSCSQDISQACSGVVDKFATAILNKQQNNFTKKSSSGMENGICGEAEVNEEMVAASSDKHEMVNGGAIHEEERNKLARGDEDIEHQVDGESNEESDEDLYENDDPVTPLDVEDHSSEFGCLELETLCLENVNLTDPVAAVLMQHLPKLRHLNVSDTDICNPWRLLDQKQSIHLKYMQQLDVKSTALSRTALEMIPKYHPDLQKLSISSTTLPPHTYANIGRLTGVVELELIGGQFYPCEPAEIFVKGIAPAVHAIGPHLFSLNLTYFAHINLEVIILNCPNLEHLDLSFTYIKVVYPCASLDTCCSHLTLLNLAYSHIDATETDFEDQKPVAEEKALQSIIGSPPALEEVYLGGLALHNDIVTNMFSNEVHPLRILNISRCRMITIEGLKHIWDRCPHIQLIDLTHCREISVNQFREFQSKCFRERPGFKLEGKIDWK